MAEEGFEMLFSKFRQRREEEQKEYDDIIQQACLLYTSDAADE